MKNNFFGSIPAYTPGVMLPMSELREILAEAFKQGYLKCAIDLGKEKSFYSYNQLIKKYTRTVVDGWIITKKIIPLKVGNSFRFDRRGRITGND